MLFFDVETDGHLEDATRVWCIVAWDSDTGDWFEFGPDQVVQGLDLLRNAESLAAHNGLGFDLPVLAKLHGLTIPRDRLVDTLVLSRLAFPDLDGVTWMDADSGKRVYQTHSVGAWGRRFERHKGEWSDFSQWNPAMLEYCRQDVSIVAELYEHVEREAPWAISERCSTVEQEFAGHIQDMMWRGAPFNVALAEEMAEEAGRAKAALYTRLSKIHPGWQDKKVKKKKILPFVPTSRVQITKYFKEKYKWQPVHYTKSGAPQVTEDILEAVPFEEGKDLAELFRLAKLEASLSTGDKGWLKNVKSGRIHGTVIHNGTPTGRCRHSGPNLGNIPRKGRWLRCRDLFSVGDGYSLVGADASSLELVILAHYLSFWDDGEYVKVVSEGDPHSHNQQAAGLSTRDQAKTLIYALVYGAGDRKLGTIVSSSDCERVLAREGRALRRKFLEAIPAFNHLVEAVKEAAKSRGYLVGLDGRHVPVRSEHSALNFLCQSGGAVVMKKATNLANRQVDGMVLHVHDEMQFEVSEAEADGVGGTVAECIRQAGRDMGLECPLDAEYKVGKSWKETH